MSSDHLIPPSRFAFPSEVSNGMSLRDYFAAKAMQGVLANELLYRSVIENSAASGIETHDGLAMYVGRIADAMLKTREA